MRRAEPARRVAVLAHRGASQEAPENTLAAFQLAMEAGADGFELDVRRCGTGQVVVHHDATTGRVSGEDLALATSSLSRLRALDLGQGWGGRFRGERIPLLDEVLAGFPGAKVNVELKSAGLPDVALAREVARLVRARGPERCLVSAFDPFSLAAFGFFAPSVRTGLLLADQRWHRARELAGLAVARPEALHPERTLITSARAVRWRGQGLEVNAWTVDEPGEVKRLARFGVSTIITNRPALALAALREGPI